ncbi:putative transposase [Variovorax sp. HW608]|uniref:RNA-guided endonuclease InsQ/TnpB family protein n=1 Tax=Variovorax sp. HW608 TaxID=1034889 RepID=UPI00081FBE11|nr:RNA-guided endonuclease TnpB family protein [Variovorax sp. HW608]SCK38431.1 putative transposase [Variovorax sp. HW608]
MQDIKAYRFQMRTRPKVEAQLRRFAGMGRWVWCRALAEQRARHARGEKYAGYAQMCTWLTDWRNDPKTGWLADGPVHPQQQVLRRLDEAYKRFFATVKAGGGRAGPPRFKRYGEEPGIRFPDPKQFVLDAANGRLKLPKLGWVRLRMSQPLDGVVRNVSVTREGERWFVSLQVESKEVAPALDVAPTLGIDLGLAKFAALSDETSVEPLKALERQQRRLARYQRAVARKKKGSTNRRKAVVRLGNLYRRIARQRSDWLHKLTTELADRHAVIALEDLRIASMSASARGTVEAPGKNVRAKAGLNRGILDAAWGEFARQLAYKVQWRGGRVILVNPAYTSRTCRCCGHERAENRKTQAVFSCAACGHTENADVHAAKNILAAGRATWLSERQGARSHACGGDVSRKAAARPPRAAPAKQEPTEAKALA